MRLFKKLNVIFIAALLSLFAKPAIAQHSNLAVNGADLSLWWILPFAGLLLSIAIIPVASSGHWHNHFGKISAFWAFCLVVPMLFYFGYKTTLHEVLDVFALEYVPFIVLLLALYTISGGIRITGYLKGTPIANTSILLIGTLLASWMGTTGAAMLMIRPLLRANSQRKNKVHTIIFFIFIVCNAGGALTPLGDPPLLLGFLLGVNFFWTTTHLWWEMLFIVAVLIIIYYAWDSYHFNKENRQATYEQKARIGIEGKFNLVLLAVVAGLVFFSGIIDFGSLMISNIALPIAGLIRDAGLLILTGVSWHFTSKKSRAANGFSWFPIKEVGYLFAGIFITIIAPLAMLEVAQHGLGPLSFVHTVLFNEAGQPNNVMFFWITGGLSSFLDNAPTYLIFFNAAGGNAQVLMTQMAETLVAISSGAVFFGAMSYIGNAPNFMVKTIAEKSGVDMPSFGGYLLWSIGILSPIYLLFTWVFF